MDSFGFGCLSVFELVLCCVVVFDCSGLCWIVLSCFGFLVQRSCFFWLYQLLSVRVWLFIVVLNWCSCDFSVV